MASPLLYKLCAEAYIQEPEEDDSREQSITPAASNYDYSLDSVRNTVSPIAAAAIATPGSASVKKVNDISWQISLLLSSSIVNEKRVPE